MFLSFFQMNNQNYGLSETPKCKKKSILFSAMKACNENLSVPFIIAFTVENNKKLVVKLLKSLNGFINAFNKSVLYVVSHFQLHYCLKGQHTCLFAFAYSGYIRSCVISSANHDEMSCQ